MESGCVMCGTCTPTSWCNVDSYVNVTFVESFAPARCHNRLPVVGSYAKYVASPSGSVICVGLSHVESQTYRVVAYFLTPLTKRNVLESVVESGRPRVL